MRRTSGAARLGGVAALAVWLGLVAPGALSPAFARPDKQPDTTPNDHPSGKDRSEEPGGRTQGRSTSDPDGMTNGGADKPGGNGGFDSDKDGNNGCGNDDDFEDDNNGNCGGLHLGTGTGGTEAGDVEGSGAVRSQGNAGNHLGRVKHAGTGTASVGSQAVKHQGIGSLSVAGRMEVPAQVLGVQFARNRSGAVAEVLGNDTVRTLATAGTGVGGLAATGMPVASLAMLGTLLVGSGTAFVAWGRRRLDA